MMLLNPDNYTYVECIHNLASHVGGKVGKLDLNVVVKGLGAYYQVTHNGKIIHEVNGSREAAEVYNKVLTDNGITA
jgi:hypothetical protein